MWWCIMSLAIRHSSPFLSGSILNIISLLIYLLNTTQKPYKVQSIQRDNHSEFHSKFYISSKFLFSMMFWRVYPVGLSTNTELGGWDVHNQTQGTMRDGGKLRLLLTYVCVVGGGLSLPTPSSLSTSAFGCSWRQS